MRVAPAAPAGGGVQGPEPVDEPGVGDVVGLHLLLAQVADQCCSFIAQRVVLGSGDHGGGQAAQVCVQGASLPTGWRGRGAGPAAGGPRSVRWPQAPSVSLLRDAGVSEVHVGVGADQQEGAEVVGVRLCPAHHGADVVDRGGGGVLGGEAVVHRQDRAWAFRARRRQRRSWESRSPKSKPPPWTWTTRGSGSSLGRYSLARTGGAPGTSTSCTRGRCGPAGRCRWARSCARSGALCAPGAARTALTQSCSSWSASTSDTRAASLAGTD